MTTEELKKFVREADKFDFRDIYDIVREEYNTRLFDGRGY